MNIAFFLIAKKETVYLPFESTMRQALEKMEYHHYTAVPLVDSEGKYAGTLTEGDLLWKLKNTPELTFSDTERILIKNIPRRMVNTPVHISEEIENLLSLAVIQNFVPVVDDNEIFIGIIRRREIIEYFVRKYKGM
ncbi:CBS domain-containing protein [Sporomusa acidovorans]|uniref:CBS domain-containing protein n=1 Tax=Sporomusa acidovorans (strain ATCC 49682 / DSM 3132 / Mol) TaxID=1123286 RepID=A0ABZ3JBJ2_SPOA4|nr:CBS domain-containing protein [Sporomusa acidovorans]OZC18586.1 CBS domain protein [Sporomusa acidovorans DSM 3132]SDF52492.1 CBS domain-containing protein [Sporomusa acidovorans]